MPITEIANLARTPNGTRLEGLQEVIGYKRVRRSAAGGNEVQVEVILAGIAANGEFLQNIPSTSHWLGCGHWMLAFIGSRWKDGVHVGERGRKLETSQVGEGDNLDFGEVQYTKSRTYFPSLPPATPCFRIKLASGGQHSALVPVMEVVRALFGVSSGFLKQTLDGLRCGFR